MGKHMYTLATVVCAHTEHFWALQWLDLQKSALGVDSSFRYFLSLFLPFALFFHPISSLFLCSL